MASDRTITAREETSFTYDKITWESFLDADNFEFDRDGDGRVIVENAKTGDAMLFDLERGMAVELEGSAKTGWKVEEGTRVAIEDGLDMIGSASGGGPVAFELTEFTFHDGLDFV